MEVLSDAFDVGVECFASPLNCYFRRYCSAFPDTDLPFGSCGSFLDFQPLEGSFQANPPFQEDMMEAMVEHMERLLRQATGPLSFAVFVPHWTSPPCSAIERLKSSPHLRMIAEMQAKAHQYVSGVSHTQPPGDNPHFVACHSSLVLFLQNEAGFQKWTPTPEKLARIRDVWASLE